MKNSGKVEVNTAELRRKVQERIQISLEHTLQRQHKNNLLLVVLFPRTLGVALHCNPN